MSQPVLLVLFLLTAGTLVLGIVGGLLSLPH